MNERIFAGQMYHAATPRPPQKLPSNPSASGAKRFSLIERK